MTTSPRYRCPSGHALSFEIMEPSHASARRAKVSAHGNLIHAQQGRHLIRCTECGDQFHADVDPAIPTDA